MHAPILVDVELIMQLPAAAHVGVFLGGVGQLGRRRLRSDRHPAGLAEAVQILQDLCAEGLQVVRGVGVVHVRHVYAEAACVLVESMHLHRLLWNSAAAAALDVVSALLLQIY